MQTTHYKTIEYKNKPFRITYVYHPYEPATEYCPAWSPCVEIAEITLKGCDVSDVLDAETIDRLHDIALAMHEEHEMYLKIEAEIEQQYFV